MIHDHVSYHVKDALIVDHWCHFFPLFLGRLQWNLFKFWPPRNLMAPDPVIRPFCHSINNHGSLEWDVLESLSLAMMPPLQRFKGYRPKGMDDFLHEFPVNHGNQKLYQLTPGAICTPTSSKWFLYVHVYLLKRKMAQSQCVAWYSSK